MAKTQKVKISLQASLKEYEFEIEDKKKFTAEIEALIKEQWHLLVYRRRWGSRHQHWKY